MDGRRASPLTIGRPEWDIFLVDASEDRLYHAIGSGPLHGKASLLLRGKRGSPKSSELSMATGAPSSLPRLAFPGVAGTPAKAKSDDQPTKAKPVSLTKSTPGKTSKAGKAGRTRETLESETWDDVRYTSAVRMQKMQRGHSTRLRLRAEHLTVEDARAVTKIQAVARGRMVRRREAAKEAAKQAKAATKLATVMRGKLERRAVRKAKEIIELEVTKLVRQAEERAAHQASLVSKGRKAQAELHALVASTQQGPNASWSESIGMRMRAAEATRDKQLELLYKEKKERALVELLQMVAESEEAVASREVHTATAAAVQGRLLGLVSQAQTAMAAEAEGGRKVNEGARRCALHDLVSLAKVEAEAEAAAEAERMARAKSEAVLGRLGILLSLVQTLVQAAATMQLGATQEKLREIVKLARSVGEAELAEAAGAEAAGAAADAAANAAAVRVRLHKLVGLAQEVAAAAGDAVPRELKLRELLRMAQEVCRSQKASEAEATERAKASAVRSCIPKATAEAQALVAEGTDASREQLRSLVEMASEVKLREMADHAAREVNAKAAGVRTQLANLLSATKTAKAEDASGVHSSTELGDQMRELISLAKQVAKAEVAAESEATKAAEAAEMAACAKAVAVHGHLEALVRVAAAIADSDDVRSPTADPQFKQLALQLRVLARELLRMDGDADAEARAVLGEHVGGPRAEHLGEFILGPKASALRSKLQHLVAMASACELRVANDMTLVSRAAAAGAAAALAVAALPGYLFSAATSKASALPRAASVAAGDIRTLPSGESAEGATVQEQLRALLSLAMEVARMENELFGVSDIEAAANEAIQNTLGGSSEASKLASRVLSAATTRMAAQRAKAATKIEAVCRGKHARKEVAEGLTRQQLKLQRYVAFTGGEAGMGGLLSGGTDSFLIWAATRPTVAYPEVILNDLFSQRKTCVARLRTNSDLTRLLRNGDYYVAVPEQGGEGGAGAGPLLTYKQASDATVPGSAEAKAAITAVVAHESANAYDNSHKPWRVPANTKSAPPVYKGQHLLLRCWAIESHAEFGSAWRSPNMGSHLVTPNMQKACGIEVHDASDVQRLYDRLYPDDDLTEILPKPDAVICHVVELVAVLSLPHEATAASTRDYRVTKALEPSTQAILASKEKAKKKKKKVLKALPEPLPSGAVAAPEPPPSKRSPTTSMTAAKSPTAKATPKATPPPSFRR